MVNDDDSSVSIPMNLIIREKPLNHVINEITIISIGIYTVKEVPKTGTISIFDMSLLNDVSPVHLLFNIIKKLYLISE